MPLTLSSLTKEYVETIVSARYDPTSLPVEFAFVAEGVEPEEADWSPGGWRAVGEKPYVARILIGPGTNVVLADGKYRAWLRIVATPEVPVRPFDTLTIK